MGYLNNSVITVDAILTKKGRELNFFMDFYIPKIRKNDIIEIKSRNFYPIIISYKILYIFYVFRGRSEDSRKVSIMCKYQFSYKRISNTIL